MLAAPLAVSAGLVFATIVVQIIGMAVVIWIMRARNHRHGSLLYFLQQSGVILLVVTGLVLTHAVQIALYTGVYIALDAFSTFEEALYFSVSSFTTVGYGEITMEPPWRIVSAVQSANGFLVLGWSTVFLISVISRLGSVEIAWLNGDGASRDGPERGEG